MLQLWSYVRLLRLYYYQTFFCLFVLGNKSPSVDEIAVNELPVLYDTALSAVDTSPRLTPLS